MIESPRERIEPDASRDGPTVLLLPKSCNDADAGRSKLSRWESGFRCVTASQIGYGGMAERPIAADIDGLHEAEIFYIAWRPSATAIMRGWQPRRPTPRQRRRWCGWISQRLVALFDYLGEWQELAESRRALLSLDDRVLRDIGIDRATARHLGTLPSWRR